VSANFISGTSLVKNASTAFFQIDFKQSKVVTCTPSIDIIINFNGYVTTLPSPSSPHNVFMVS
jgi:hypothetical protein